MNQSSSEMVTFERRSPLKEVREFFRRLSKNKGAFVAMIYIIILVLACSLASLSPYDPYQQDIIHKLEWPSWSHLCGTDNLGRDLFTRILYGGRLSLLISLIAVGFSMFFGVMLGSIAGFYGGTTDSIIMRVLDVIMSIPGLLLSISLSIVLGTGTISMAIAISAGSIPTLTRIIRGHVLTIKAQEYIEAARVAGASDLKIILTHIIPNSMAPLIVQATLRIGAAVSLISALSFLGCGIQPPAAEWGSMVSAGRAYMRSFWPMIVFPGLAIMSTMLAFNLFGDGVRDALDPKLRR